MPKIVLASIPQLAELCGVPLVELVMKLVRRQAPKRWAEVAELCAPKRADREQEWAKWVEEWEKKLAEEVGRVLQLEAGRYVSVPEEVQYSAQAKRSWAEPHGLGEWVDLNKAITEAAKETGTDPDVLRFLLAFNGVRYYSRTFQHTWSEAERARLKRRTKREHGTEWPDAWKNTSSTLKRLQKIRLRETLFSVKRVSPNPPHRPRDEYRWIAYYYLRGYFEMLTDDPQVHHAARIVFPRSKPESVAQGWSRKKDGIQKERLPPLVQLLSFYEAHEEKIRTCLKTGIRLPELIAPKPTMRQEIRKQLRGGPGPFTLAFMRWLKEQLPQIPAPPYQPPVWVAGGQSLVALSQYLRPFYDVAKAREFAGQLFPAYEIVDSRGWLIEEVGSMEKAGEVSSGLLEHSAT